MDGDGMLRVGALELLAAVALELDEAAEVGVICAAHECNVRSEECGRGEAQCFL